MKCVILAAGMSTRLQSVSQDLSKCLIPVGGKPIIQRILENVLEAGVKEIGVVLGYKAAELRSFIRQHFPFNKIRFIVNPKFETTNNAFSLLMARDFYKGKPRPNAPSQRLLLLDSDIVFSTNLLPFFLDKAPSDALAVRVKGPHNDEEIKVRVDGKGTLVKIGKEIPPQETYGESIGIEVFSPSTAERLFQVLEKRVKQGVGRTEFYESSFQELIEEGVRIAAVGVSDFPSVEIDTPDDLAFAETHIIPRIESSER